MVKQRRVQSDKWHPRHSINIIIIVWWLIFFKIIPTIWSILFCYEFLLYHYPGWIIDCNLNVSNIMCIFFIFSNVYKNNIILNFNKYYFSIACFLEMRYAYTCSNFEWRFINIFFIILIFNEIIFLQKIQLRFLSCITMHLDSLDLR